MRGSATVHRLLWGPTPRQELHDWSMRPWEIPAVGLPVRVAVAFCLVLGSGVALRKSWNRPSDLYWEFRTGKVLTVGSNCKFGSRRARRSRRHRENSVSSWCEGQ